MFVSEDTSIPEELLGWKINARAKGRRSWLRRSSSHPSATARGPRPYDRDLYKERNRIERFFNKLKQFRRVATRYDELLAHFMGFVKVAAMVICSILKSSLPPRSPVSFGKVPGQRALQSVGR